MSEVIFTTVHGSHLYGLAHEGSDHDIYEVREGTTLTLHQRIRDDGTDIVTGTLEAFTRRALTGSHQSCEALFSPVKVFGPGMREKYGAYLDGFRVTGGDVFAKYERTIRKFCYGDYKRRRHAARLHINLRELRRDGRMMPALNEDSIRWCTLTAEAWSGDDLVGRLLN
jgi:hypothetical protein